MPCRDGRDDILDAITNHERQHFASISPAILCAILSHAEKMGCMDALLDPLDFDEAGVTRQELGVWWELHKQRDEAKRTAEAEKLRRDRLALEARAKLTPEEMAVLGVK